MTYEQEQLFEVAKKLQSLCEDFNCDDCPINSMMYRDDCEIALGKHLLGGEKID